jgi:hypothetical protein
VRGSALVAVFIGLLCHAPEVRAQATDSLAVLSPKDPGRALLYSAILPGTGQVYAESYWYAGAFFALNATFLSQIVIQHNDALRYRNDWTNYSPQDPADPEFLALEQRYLDAFDRRNMYIWLWGFTYILNLMNAYVEASLFAFDERIDLQVLQNMQVDGRAVATLNLRIRF